MRIATLAFTGALVAAVVCLAIAPARHWTQDLATCRGGERTHPDSVTARDGRTASDFAYVCQKDTGPVGISQTSATLGGIGVSLLGGLVLGAAGGALLTRRR